MIKAYAETKLNGGAIILGLSDTNVKQLLAGIPLIVEVKSVPGAHTGAFSCVALVCGETEQSILQAISDSIAPHTFKTVK